MIDIGSKAPGFSLKDHLGRTISLDAQIGSRHTLLAFYPLAFTPT